MKSKILMGLAFLLLAGCSASVETSGGGGGVGGADVPFPDGIDNSFSHKVTGPNVEGNWTSGCVLDSYENLYRLRQITFSGTTVVRRDNLYSDSNCKVLADQSEAHGTYRWAATTSYGGYLLDYRFDLGNGMTALTSEELLLEKGKMYLSNFYSGFGSIDKTFPMMQVGR